MKYNFEMNELIKWILKLIKKILYEKTITIKFHVKFQIDSIIIQRRHYLERYK